MRERIARELIRHEAQLAAFKIEAIFKYLFGESYDRHAYLTADFAKDKEHVKLSIVKDSSIPLEDINCGITGMPNMQFPIFVIEQWRSDEGITPCFTPYGLLPHSSIIAKNREGKEVIFYFKTSYIVNRTGQCVTDLLIAETSDEPADDESIPRENVVYSQDDAVQIEGISPGAFEKIGIILQEVSQGDYRLNYYESM